jgi:hypothetical protein
MPYTDGQYAMSNRRGFPVLTGALQRTTLVGRHAGIGLLVLAMPVSLVVCFKNPMRSHLSFLQNPDASPEHSGTQVPFHCLPASLPLIICHPQLNASFALSPQDVLTLFIYLFSTGELLRERSIAGTERVNPSHRPSIPPDTAGCIQNASMALSRGTSSSRYRQDALSQGPWDKEILLCLLPNRVFRAIDKGCGTYPAAPRNAAFRLHDMASVLAPPFRSSNNCP